MHITVVKHKKILELWDGNTMIYRFAVGIGKSEQGTKLQEGDYKTPEGLYRVCVKNPNSHYHLSFAINYPNRIDAARGLASKLISLAEYEVICAADQHQAMPPWNTALGGAIYVHGELEKQSWSEGCIRLRDNDMELLYPKVSLNIPVTLLP